MSEECLCHNDNYVRDALIPQVGIIQKITQETPDVRSFQVIKPGGGKLIEQMPGQCAMVCAPGIGEAMFSITSSPTVKEYNEFSIKECGELTTYLHNLHEGDQILIRGPYGNHFPVEDKFKGRNLLFIAGGIGLAPLRSAINYCLANREDYGTINVLYGSRSKRDLVKLDEIQNVWMKAPDTHVYLTIDREDPEWDGHVGFVPPFITELKPDAGMTVIMCGPPILIHMSLKILKDLGFKDEQIFTTMEMRMKCGIGKCGRCNIGDKFVCKDGPVFSFDQLGELPPEY